MFNCKINEKNDTDEKMWGMSVLIGIIFTHSKYFIKWSKIMRLSSQDYGAVGPVSFDQLPPLQ